MFCQGAYVYLMGTFLIHTATLPQRYITAVNSNQKLWLFYSEDFIFAAKEHQNHSSSNRWNTVILHYLSMIMCQTKHFWQLQGHDHVRSCWPANSQWVEIGSVHKTAAVNHRCDLKDCNKWNQTTAEGPGGMGVTLNLPVTNSAFFLKWVRMKCDKMYRQMKSSTQI